MTTRRALWIDAAGVDAIRRRFREQEPVTRAIYAAAMEWASRDVQEVQDLPDKIGTGPHSKHHFYPQACAVACLITGKKLYADRGLEYVLWWTSQQTGNLGRGSYALTAAVVNECCHAVWAPEQRVSMTRRLVELHESFYYGVASSGGDPHVVTNNHWGVNHCSSAIAAMSAHGGPMDEEGTPCDVSEGVAWARGRAKPYLGHLGDRGLYHEGLGYMLYPASFFLPMVLAAKNFDGTDYCSELPQLRRAASSVYATVCARQAVSNSPDTPGRWGSMLSWNDAGYGWCLHNPAITLIALAPDEQVPALKWMFDRLNGLEGDGEFAPGWCGWFFSLVYYPYDVQPQQPVDTLPTFLCDLRQGLAVVRSGYEGADDAILGAYAKNTFIGGHRQDDAGSVRMMALGHDWMIGGGQARADAPFQSIFFPETGRADAMEGKGAVCYLEETDRGAVVGMDLRRVNGAYCERWLGSDFSGESGCDAVIALLDLADDHLNRPWLWTHAFENHIECSFHEDGAGYTLRTPGEEFLVARFLGETPAGLTLEKMPDSQRTFQSAKIAIRYPGRPYVLAKFPHVEHHGVYVVMAVGRGEAPEITRTDGLAVKIGDYSWRRPFSAGIPEAFEPLASGTLCRWPSGRGDH